MSDMTIWHEPVMIAKITKAFSHLRLAICLVILGIREQHGADIKTGKL